MFTQLSAFLRKHEPITQLLLRMALLAVLALGAADFHKLTNDVADIADRVDQMQTDITNLREDIESADEVPDAPAKLERAPI